MAKKIKFGTELFSDLHLFFNMEEEVLASKKARLFPLGNTTDENQTTSIFLSSLQAVKEYREELLVGIGVNKIKNRNVSLHVFTEVYNEEQTERLDGVIVLTSGRVNPVVEWIGFVESKVKQNAIDSAQIERYIEFGREIGVNTIITISNELTTSPLDTPIETKKARNFNLYHWSWTYLKVMSTRLLRTDVVNDEDHVFILSELRRYFDDHKNISNYINMGPEWKDCVQRIHEVDISKKIDNDTLKSVVDSYKQEEKDISLQLTDNTPFYIQLLVKNNEERDVSIAEQLQNNKTISSTYFIDNDKKRTFTVEVDFIRKSISCQTSVVVENGKAKAQTSALLKKLENTGVTEDIMVEAKYIRNKSVDACSLLTLFEEKNKNDSYSIMCKDFGDEIKSFNIFIKRELGRDFQAPRNFIDHVEGLGELFLLHVATNL